MSSEPHDEIRDYIEQRFLLDGTWPKAELISHGTGHSIGVVMAVLAESKLEQQLKSRGISQRDIESAQDGLTTEQLRLANSLLDITDTRSDKKKMSDLGVTTTKYQAWLRLPKFSGYMRTRAELLLGDSMHVAHLALLDNVGKGDLGSIKTYYELTGRYSSKTLGDLNVEFVMVRLLEIIQKYVRDPLVLEAISNDMLGLVGGNIAQPALLPPVGGQVVYADSLERGYDL